MTIGNPKFNKDPRTLTAGEAVNDQRGNITYTLEDGAQRLHLDNRSAGEKIIFGFNSTEDVLTFRFDGGYFGGSNQFRVDSSDDFLDLIDFVSAAGGVNGGGNSAVEFNAEGDLILLMDADSHFRGDTKLVFKDFLAESTSTLVVGTFLDNDPDFVVPDVGNIPTDNAQDRLRAFVDDDEDFSFDAGESFEDLATYGNGTLMTALPGASDDGGLVDVTPAGGGLTGNQFHLGVGNGGHISGAETLTIAVQNGGEAIAGELTIRGAVAANPQNGVRADIVAGTEFQLKLFDGATLVEALQFEVATAQRAFTADFSDDALARFDKVEVSSLNGSFTFDDMALFLV